MNEALIQTAAIISAAIMMAIAIFQILLFLGFPLAEYSWGGKYKGILPQRLRILSLYLGNSSVFDGHYFFNTYKCVI